MKLKKKQIGLYLEPLFYNEFAHYCNENHTTISAAIRDSIRKKIESAKRSSVRRRKLKKTSINA